MVIFPAKLAIGVGLVTSPIPHKNSIPANKKGQLKPQKSTQDVEMSSVDVWNKDLWKAVFYMNTNYIRLIFNIDVYVVFNCKVPSLSLWELFQTSTPIKKGTKKM